MIVHMYTQTAPNLLLLFADLVSFNYNDTSYVLDDVYYQNISDSFILAAFFFQWQNIKVLLCYSIVYVQTLFNFHSFVCSLDDSMTERYIFFNFYPSWINVWYRTVLNSHVSQCVWMPINSTIKVYELKVWNKYIYNKTYLIIKGVSE